MFSINNKFIVYQEKKDLSKKLEPMGTSLPMHYTQPKNIIKINNLLRNRSMSKYYVIMSNPRPTQMNTT